MVVNIQVDYRITITTVRRLLHIAREIQNRASSMQWSHNSSGVSGRNSNLLIKDFRDWFF